MRQVEFRFIGGPHDGDRAKFPISSVPTSKSLVLQDKKSPLGLLHKYFFNLLTFTATYQGEVRVKEDALNN